MAYADLWPRLPPLRGPQQNQTLASCTLLQTQRVKRRAQDSHSTPSHICMPHILCQPKSIGWGESARRRGPNHWLCWYPLPMRQSSHPHISSLALTVLAHCSLNDCQSVWPTPPKTFLNIAVCHLNEPPRFDIDKCWWPTSQDFRAIMIRDRNLWML